MLAADVQDAVFLVNSHTQYMFGMYIYISFLKLKFLYLFITGIIQKISRHWNTMFKCRYEKIHKFHFVIETTVLYIFRPTVINGSFIVTCRILFGYNAPVERVLFKCIISLVNKFVFYAFILSCCLNKNIALLNELKRNYFLFFVLCFKSFEQICMTTQI